MVLAAPEFVIAQRVELLDEIEVAAELQHRMLADRVMRGEEGSELEARHGISPERNLFLIALSAGYVLAAACAIAQTALRLKRNAAMRAADGSLEASGYRR